MKTKLTVTGLAVLLSLSAALAQPVTESDAPRAYDTGKPDAGNLRAFVELARSDIRVHKALIIAENLPMTEEEAAEFWPLHREYEAALSKLNDEKLALIVRYAEGYKAKALNDKEASKLAEESFDLEEKRTKLRRKFFKEFQTAIPAIKAVRFFQIENQLTMVLDLQVAASIPLIK
ncbi:MAG: hypothetical protein AB9869_09435 [Verrucomicrobiia bacterium]